MKKLSYLCVWTLVVRPRTLVVCPVMVCLVAVLSGCGPGASSTPVPFAPTSAPAAVASAPAGETSASAAMTPAPAPTVTPERVAAKATQVPAAAPESSTPTPVPPTATQPATPMPPASTPSPVPTLTPVPDEGPVVVYFRADVGADKEHPEADPGDTITLEWQATGATYAVLTHLLPTGQAGQFWEVETSGSMAYAIPVESRNSETFDLFVADDAGRSVRAGLVVTLRCPDTWFFSPAPDECPSGPAVLTDGAEQRFERGVMLWNKAEGAIYVLFDDGGGGSWKVYPDRWAEGEPASDPDIVPPAGRYQPVRGFGLVWREESGVRDRLGWAVGEEAGYQTAIQRTARFKYNEVYIKALDGGVWALGPEGSEWDYVP